MKTSQTIDQMRLELPTLDADWSSRSLTSILATSGVASRRSASTAESSRIGEPTPDAALEFLDSDGDVIDTKSIQER